MQHQPTDSCGWAMNTEQANLTAYGCYTRCRVLPTFNCQPTYSAGFMHWYHNIMGSVLSIPLANVSLPAIVILHKTITIWCKLWAWAVNNNCFQSYWQWALIFAFLNYRKQTFLTPCTRLNLSVQLRSQSDLLPFLSVTRHSRLLSASLSIKRENKLSGFLIEWKAFLPGVHTSHYSFQPRTWKIWE